MEIWRRYARSATMRFLPIGFVLAGTVLAQDVLGQVPEDGQTSRDLGILQDLPPGQSELIARGEAVYDYWCRDCHGPEMLKPGTAALATQYQGALPAALEARTDMTPEFVKFMVRQGISMMPFFRPTEISNADLEARSRYLTRNLGD